MSQELKPCPFCGAGKTDIHPNGRMWTGQRLSEPTSVSIRHWCEDVAGQPHRMIERVGRDEASAIAAWNSRAAAPPGWQPIETAPQVGTAFLLGVVGGIVRVIRWGKTSHVPLYGWCLADQGPEDFDLCTPSHWMPLPAVPDAQKEAI